MSKGLLTAVNLNDFPASPISDSLCETLVTPLSEIGSVLRNAGLREWLARDYAC